MRLVSAAFGAILLTIGAASAADTEGTVTAVDAEAMTVTLDDGNTYKLPPEMDATVITEGIDILIAYREDEDGSNQITDMVFAD